MANSDKLDRLKRQLNTRITILNNENATNTIAVQKLHNHVVRLYTIILVLAVALGLQTWLG